MLQVTEGSSGRKNLDDRGSKMFQNLCASFILGLLELLEVAGELPKRSFWSLRRVLSWSGESNDGGPGDC